MTDFETMSQVISCIDPSGDRMQPIMRRGRLLMALPQRRNAAIRALRLYQPQRTPGRMMVAAMRLRIAIGLNSHLPGSLRPSRHNIDISPPLPDVENGSCGMLLGSPEHRIRRVIASYKTDFGWEVGKIAFDRDGKNILEQEARTLQELALLTPAVIRCLGMHHSVSMSILRMPYLTGQPVKLNQPDAAIKLLKTWISDGPLYPVANFIEWPAIKTALFNVTGESFPLDLYDKFCLQPVLCHGDFARWNLLKQNDGSLIVLDWEWGHAEGMPGIDLVHYFLQDARLVRRLTPTAAIFSTIRELQRPECVNYLARTGWHGNPLFPIIACLAYKQGAGHQDNLEILRTAIALLRDV